MTVAELVKLLKQEIEAKGLLLLLPGARLGIVQECPSGGRLTVWLTEREESDENNKYD